MARPAERFRSFLAGFAVMIALAGCGSSPDMKAESPAPVTAPTKASTTAAPDKEIAPKPVDQDLVAELRGFVSPTGNVACMIDSSWARCDIIDRDWSPPPHPADCEFDYGHGITISTGGRAEFICAGDTAFGTDLVLAYGDSTGIGPMRCESAESGVTCRDTESGHGFSISQEAYQLF